jgi:hypothetical protein
MTAKPRLKIVSAQPVDEPQGSSSSTSSRESPLAAARRRAGGSFGWERPEFAWQQGATVLTPEWLAEQKAKRRK